MTSNAPQPPARFSVYPQSSPASGQPAPAPLRIGMIGCGEIAVRNAMAIKNSPFAQVSMALDLQEKLAQDLAGRHGARYTTDIAELLDSEIEAVLISTPHHLHAPLAIQAAEHGKHVIVEKPIALNPEQAQQILSACRQAGVTLSVMYCERYQPHIQRAKQIVGSGALGNFMGAALIFQADKAMAYWSGGFSGRVHTDWRTAPEKSGGGVLIFNIVHYLDIIRYLSEAEVSRVSSVYTTLDSPTQTEDSISMSLQFANRAVGSVLASSCVRGGGGWLEIRLWGMDGQLVIRNPNLAKTPLEFFSLRKFENYPPGHWHALGKFPQIDERSLFISRFAQAVCNGQAPDISGEDALAVQKIVDAAYRSGASGQAVEIVE
jgi:predicted dehydrogenase